MPTSEGGLGFRSLKEVNTVNGLKLIWRFLSGNSLWGRWIRMYLTKKKHFWEIGEKSQQGFWMWRKFLKLRDIAKTFHMKAIGNGMATSFWYDKWLEMGTLMNKLGDRGIIDLGFRREATVYEVLCSTRARRRHRTALLNEVEQQITLCRQRQRMNEDDCDPTKNILPVKLGTCCAKQDKKYIGQREFGSSMLLLNSHSSHGWQC